MCDAAPSATTGTALYSASVDNGEVIITVQISPKSSELVISLYGSSETTLKPQGLHPVFAGSNGDVKDFRKASTVVDAVRVR